jgi:predicted lipoprotein with Yx(FWY)xxD motif
MRKVPLFGAFGSIVLLAATPSIAATLVADNGKSVYVFDKDAGGTPSCYDACASNWPPYLAKASEKKGDGWAMAKRKDGSMQWTFGGKPLYFFAGDKKKGDTAGDGMGGMWHAVTQ